MSDAAPSESQGIVRSLIDSEHGTGAPTNPASIKDRLLSWCQHATQGYKVGGVVVRPFPQLITYLRST